MSMPRGMEMMLASLVKMLGLDPALMMRSIEDIGKSLHSAASDMATIRRQNNAIMAHLGIADPTGDDHNARLLNGHSGHTGRGTDSASDSGSGA